MLTCFTLLVNTKNIRNFIVHCIQKIIIIINSAVQKNSQKIKVKKMFVNVCKSKEGKVQLRS